MPAINIRPIRYPEEYDQVYALWARAGEGIHLRHSDEPAEMDKKMQRDPELFLVAETDGRLVGAVLGGFDGRRGMVYHLAVAPAWRRQGVGEQLMQALEARLRALGCTRSYLLVTPENATAIRFYERRGWEQLDLLVYAKDI